MRQWLLQMLRNLGMANVQLPEDLYTPLEAEPKDMDLNGPERTTRLH